MPANGHQVGNGRQTQVAVTGGREPLRYHRLRPRRLQLLTAVYLHLPAPSPASVVAQFRAAPIPRREHGCSATSSRSRLERPVCNRGGMEADLSLSECRCSLRRLDPSEDGRPPIALRPGRAIQEVVPLGPMSQARSFTSHRWTAINASQAFHCSRAIRRAVMLNHAEGFAEHTNCSHPDH
jgi:hypothetical protein